jgi:hypothetical protein
MVDIDIVKLNKLKKLFREGTYLTKTTKEKDGNTCIRNGISIFSYIVDNNNETVGIKIRHSGEENNHEDILYYHLQGKRVFSSHSSSINAAHNSTITRITSDSVIEKGFGFSHSNSEQVEFKKIIKKNKETGDITTKIYIKDEKSIYRLYRTHVDQFLR